MESKSIAKNAIFNMIYKFTNICFPLFTSIYISHVLHASGVGKVGVSQNVVQYFVLLAPLGLLNYGTREIAKIKEDRKIENHIFSELFIINFFSTIFFSFSYFSLIGIFDRFHADRILYLVAGIPIVFNIFNVDWYYQGHEKFKFIALRNTAVKIVSLICILLFVRTKDDYVIYAFIYSMGIVANYILNIIHLYKLEVRLTLYNLHFKKHLKPVIILLCSNLAVELYTLLDTTMLGLFCGENVVGHYTNSVKLIKVVVGLVAAIAGVLLPRLSYYSKKNLIEECENLVNKIIDIMFFLALPCGMGIFILSREIVLVFFGESFEPAILTLRIGSLLMYFMGFSNLFGTQVLLTFNNEKKLLISTCIGAISNMFMNYFMIPILKQNGAIIASVISEFLVLLFTLIFAKKYLSIRINMKSFSKDVTSCLVMMVVIYVLNRRISNMYVSLPLCVFIGALVYFVMNIILKNYILFDLYRVIRGKSN